MSDGRALRVALLHHSYSTPYAEAATPLVEELAGALRAAGHDAVIVSSAPGPPRRDDSGGVRVLWLPRLPEAPLRFRGFDGPITHLPAAVLELRRGGYDVAHAFSAQDAWAARRSRLPTVFTCGAAIDRRDVASRRLRLTLLAGAVERSDALVAPGEEQRAALVRWFAVEPRVVHPGDAESHIALYRGLLDQE